MGEIGDYGSEQGGVSPWLTFLPRQKVKVHRTRQMTQYRVNLDTPSSGVRTSSGWLDLQTHSSGSSHRTGNLWRLGARQAWQEDRNFFTFTFGLLLLLLVPAKPPPSWRVHGTHPTFPLYPELIQRVLNITGRLSVILINFMLLESVCHSIQTVQTTLELVPVSSWWIY